MNRSAINLIIVVFVLLVVGLYFTANGFHLPLVRQTVNAEASTIDLTDDKALMLVLLTGFVLFNMIGMAATLYLVMWGLNRFIIQANQQPNEPFQLASGGGVDAATASATIADNALYIIIGVGVFALAITGLVLAFV